ncbi:MAG: HAMP domain-containing histidine kinase [Clostridia bacterium]|nr:HAMP domain-containing histidine kinase [Clostridia bacterium]
MKFLEFIKDKLLSVILIIFALFTIEIFLMIYNFGTMIKIYIPIIILVVYFIGIIVEFYIKKSYYNNIKENIEELEQKYLITEIIPKASFAEGKILQELLQEVNKSMLENVNKYKHIQEEYKEYIELWIHEVKIPIATSKLIIENNKNSVTKSIDEEIDKIEDYTEQALFYARSNNVEKDYVIRKVQLKEIVNSVIKKNKNQLIVEKIKVNVRDIEREIYADSKWITFILNQIIANSIKYSKPRNGSKHTENEININEDKEYNNTNKQIDIYSREVKDKVILYIKDNGIGIKRGEITRVFEKGFTGTNGRILEKKSTGIGLYLCKKLCDKLGIGLELNSIENKETEVRIIFPKGSFYKV